MTCADENLPENLPEIGADEKFIFHCGPDVACFNRCCADLTLPLTPYDILRLRRQLGMDSAELLRTFTTMRSFPDTGFPLPLLRMIESPDAPCPFVTPAGCSVYEGRPGACRHYPLGRGTRIVRDGIAERFFLVREAHCLGFEHGPEHTPLEWLRQEGLQKYNYFNDLYMRLMSMVHAGGRALEPRLASMTLVCLFQLEQFRQLIEKMNIFARLNMDQARQEKIMGTSLENEEACLEFAFEWLEMTIFGIAPNKGGKDV